MAKKAFKAAVGGALGDMLNMAQSACEMPSESQKTAKNEQKPKEKPIRASVDLDKELYARLQQARISHFNNRPMNRVIIQFIEEGLARLR